MTILPEFTGCLQFSEILNWWYYGFYDLRYQTVKDMQTFLLNEFRMSTFHDNLSIHLIVCAGQEKVAHLLTRAPTANPS